MVATLSLPGTRMNRYSWMMPLARRKLPSRNGIRMRMSRRRVPHFVSEDLNDRVALGAQGRDAATQAGRRERPAAQVAA